jgi:hypothetical protein
MNLKSFGVQTDSGAPDLDSVSLYSEVLGSNHGRDTGFLTEDFRDISQFIESNADMVGHDHFPPNPFEIYYSSVILLSDVIQSRYGQQRKRTQKKKAQY